MELLTFSKSDELASLPTKVYNLSGIMEGMQIHQEGVGATIFKWNGCSYKYGKCPVSLHHYLNSH